jgi:hypothetical protein
MILLGRWMSTFSQWVRRPGRREGLTQINVPRPLCRLTWNRVVVTSRSGRNMKRTLAASLLALTMAFAPGVAVAKGCIKGAIVGGVGGHTTGHGTFTGALVGCITGHTAAKVHERMRERTAQQRAQEQARRAQPRVTEVGTAPAPGHVHSVHNRTAYMYVPPHRTSHHTQKMVPGANAQ